MNQKQKEQVVQDILQALSQNNTSYAEVPEIIRRVQTELSEMCQQQIIKLP